MGLRTCQQFKPSDDWECFGEGDTLLGTRDQPTLATGVGGGGRGEEWLWTPPLQIPCVCSSWELIPAVTANGF